MDEKEMGKFIGGMAWKHICMPSKWFSHTHELRFIRVVCCTGGLHNEVAINQMPSAN